MKENSEQNGPCAIAVMADHMQSALKDAFNATFRLVLVVVV